MALFSALTSMHSHSYLLFNQSMNLYMAIHPPQRLRFQKHSTTALFTLSYTCHCDGKSTQ